ncbi:hypothetical protein Tco_0295171 [Tanacetum coccineum]
MDFMSLYQLAIYYGVVSPLAQKGSMVLWVDTERQFSTHSGNETTWAVIPLSPRNEVNSMVIDDHVTIST